MFDFCYKTYPVIIANFGKCGYDAQAKKNNDELNLYKNVCRLLIEEIFVNEEKNKIIMLEEDYSLHQFQYLLLSVFLKYII